MSDDREREHCLSVVEEWADNPHLRLSDLFARERAAAAAEARDKVIGDLSFWHAQLNADWNESPTEYKDGLRDGCEFAERRVRALLTEEG